MRLRFFFLLLLGGLLTLPTVAQQNTDSRERQHLFSIGHTHLYDSYLSPLDYTGWNVAYTHLRRRSFSRGQQQQILELTASEATNTSGYASYYDVELQYGQAWHYDLSLCAEQGVWTFALGPQWAAHLGGTYSTRNGNNPAQGRIAIEGGVSGVAERKFRLWGTPSWRWRTQLDVPLLGAMFSPNYAQSYYEIFTLGNYDSNIRITTPFSAPSLRLLSVVMLPIGKSATLTLGYKADIRQSAVNQLKRHAWNHTFVLGFVQNIQILR